MTIGIDGSIGGEGLGRSEARTASDALDLFGRRPGWMRDGLCREHAEVDSYPRTGESLRARPSRVR